MSPHTLAAFMAGISYFLMAGISYLLAHSFRIVLVEEGKRSSQDLGSFQNSDLVIEPQELDHYRPGPITSIFLWSIFNFSEISSLTLTSDSVVWRFCNSVHNHVVPPWLSLDMIYLSWIHTQNWCPLSMTYRLLSSCRSPVSTHRADPGRNANYSSGPFFY